MIGSAYWSTGLVLAPGSDGFWRVWLDFFDDGFAENNSTEGRLRLRYEQTDLDEMVAVLVADARRLGIQLGSPAEGPTVYAADDRDDLQLVANEQAARLGWRLAYERTVA